MNIYPISNILEGRLAIAPCPLGNERLNSEIKFLKQENYSLVVSMLTLEEQEKHGLNAEPAICAENAINYLNYPNRRKKCHFQ